MPKMLLICGIGRKNWFNDIELYIAVRYSVVKIKFRRKLPTRIKHVLRHLENANAGRKHTSLVNLHFRP
jgi:hypothetical protein